MRLTGGADRGRKLRAPRGSGTRPTASRVREAIFNILGPAPEGPVLDLYAGTGALGLEALSRGARSCDFVETRPSSLHALRANIAALRMRERVRVFKRDALPFAAALAPDAYDIAFVDPPYESRMLDRVIDGWRARAFSRYLVVEHAATHEVPRGTRRLAFDDTVVTMYQHLAG